MKIKQTNKQPFSLAYVVTLDGSVQQIAISS